MSKLFDEAMLEAMTQAARMLEHEGELLARIDELMEERCRNDTSHNALQDQCVALNKHRNQIKAASNDLLNAVKQNRYATSAEKEAAKELSKLLTTTGEVK